MSFPPTTVSAVMRAVQTHSLDLGLILAASLVSYIVVLHYLPRVALILLRRNLFGIDINKCTLEERKAFGSRRHEVMLASSQPDFAFVWQRKQKPQQAGTSTTTSTASKKKRTSGEEAERLLQLAIPESLGILAGTVYLCTLLPLVASLQVVGSVDVAPVYGAVTTVTVMLLLGFVDDVLDIRWRYKLLLSAIGSVPLLCAYDGSTSILLPPIVAGLFGSARAPSAVYASVARLARSLRLPPPSWQGATLLVSLGGVYAVYLSMLCVFCTNSINILAGVNGLEVGQSLIIAVASVVYNIVQLRLDGDAAVAVGGGTPQDLLRGISLEHQVRALALLGPFIGVSLALWRYNRYPARVFVGDSYTYFAGTVIAVAGITGVYSKTLLLFFLPQIFNFLISLPQLFGVVVCPRHRVPLWNPATDRLENSRNYTVLNAVLAIAGPLPEAALTRYLLLVQAASCALGFVIRFYAASLAFEHVY